MDKHSHGDAPFSLREGVFMSDNQFPVAGALWLGEEGSHVRLILPEQSGFSRVQTMKALLVCVYGQIMTIIMDCQSTPDPDAWKLKKCRGGACTV
jgi:hypothetical protein